MASGETKLVGCCFRGCKYPALNTGPFCREHRGMQCSGCSEQLEADEIQCPSCKRFCCETCLAVHVCEVEDEDGIEDELEDEDAYVDLPDFKPGKTRFALYLQQAGDGCDYTIACGRNLYHLAADNMSAALALANLAIRGHGDDEEEIAMAVVIDVTLQANIDTKKVYAALAAKRKAAKSKKEKDAELKTLRQLKKKYEQ